MRDANKNSEPQIDRMGCYIGQVRAYEGVPLEQLAQGLCVQSLICAGWKMASGKPVSFLTDAPFSGWESLLSSFDRILDWDEYQQWLRRQRIWRHLSAGECKLSNSGHASVPGCRCVRTSVSPDCQAFNLRALQGAAVEELRDLALAALFLTPTVSDRPRRAAAFESK